MIQLLLFSETDKTRATIEKILKSEQIPVSITAVHDEAHLLDFLRTSVFNLVVLDTALARGDHLVLLKKLKLHHPAIPVLMLSMDNTRAFALQAMRMNAHGFLTSDSIALEFADAVKSIRLGRCYMTTALTA